MFRTTFKLSATKKITTNCLLLVGVMILTETAARADVVFSDDFSAATLNPAWQVLSGQGSYTVGGGDLRYFNAGPDSATTGWLNAALTLGLPFAGTNWEIDLKSASSLEWCPPPASYTGPTTPTPSCTSGAQGQEVAVKFDPTVSGTNYAGPDAAVIERNIDAYYGSNQLVASYGAVSTGNLLNPSDSYIHNNIADGTYWYQIIRNGGALTFNYSYDGATFLNGFTTTLANPTGTFNELLLGGVTFSTAASYTDYSYVDITAPSAVPEPSSFVLLALGILGIALKQCRKVRKEVPGL